MYTITTNDVNDALHQGIAYLLREGVEEQSRNGTVLVAPGPVVTEYLVPRNRVLYSTSRDANPYFHFMESLWILSGSNDVMFVEYFAKNMRAYSDDGVTSWGAYGWRWRGFFGWDQLKAVIAELKNNPTSRRCVLEMWNAWPHAGDYDQNRGMNRENAALHDHDFQVATHGGLDVPCNTHIYVDARGGRLNITVCNRSNDIVWGAYGANAVHMSFLQEYLAAQIGVPIGVYRQFSNNYHVYTDVFPRPRLEQIAYECDTLGRLPEPGPAIEPDFDEDLTLFMSWSRKHIAHIAEGFSWPKAPMFKTALMETVAKPMFQAWNYNKEGIKAKALETAHTIVAPDWRRACCEWLERRMKK